MFTKYLKFAVQAVLYVWVSAANAGSYDDFFVAIKNDNAGNVESLISRGFDPNTRDPRGQPGLTMALQEGSPKVARLLIARPDIDLDALNSAGESPLMLAALKGDLNSAQLLLDRGARVNQSGWAALHYAATGPEPKLVQLLLQRGAVVDAASPNETTPLMMAAQYGAEESVELLLSRGADANRTNQKAMRAADFARLSGRQSLVRLLEKSAAPR